MKKIFFLGLFSLVFTSCDDATNKDEAANMPLEQTMAILDANGPVEKTDIKVVRIKTLLKYLSEVYDEPIDSIADLTSRAQGVIHNRGIEETNLNILEQMNKAGKVENMPYRDAVVLYIMLRSKGMK